jgi:hypothetical protein
MFYVVFNARLLEGISVDEHDGCMVNFFVESKGSSNLECYLPGLIFRCCYRLPGSPL